MNTANFVSDRLIYIPDLLSRHDLDGLLEAISAITERSWRYNDGYKHLFIGGQLTRTGKLIQSSTPAWMDTLYQRIEECTAVHPNYAELYAIQSGQGCAQGVKSTTATFTLGTHLVAQTDVSATPILLEPNSLLIVVDGGPPKIVPGCIDRVSSPPAHLLNSHLLKSPNCSRLARHGGHLTRSDGYVLNMYDIKRVTDAFKGVLG
ncbi:hypothetical protein J056_001834 [Wallemia ichthyophaga EXF-994]|uniref:Uncharacterized protein n=2 Tax=Wallemia ichthyophaga TaxID=245174 RepID=A0A4T0FYJ1_WALIC|nr:uncharacterized protein J056_001834 [Wallemia ichthyophaga EXF-994]EOQ99511.1 hypothetical protein J056_001834 [Wallemia ichthyophaga EXF-994]TIA93791.1 hypothetical protein E3P96_04163 [Wallemia ichthyophaga]TIB25913.1 hypothetical protein E3P86_04164 [Wallemia ichthyophaga]